MGKGRLCTNCGSKTEPFDAKQCANPACRAVFCELEPSSDRCGDCGSRPATINVGKWVCGDCFDRGRFGESKTHGPGREVWEEMREKHRDELDAARRRLAKRDERMPS